MSAVEWMTSTVAQQLVMTTQCSRQFQKKNVLTATDITLISPQVQWFNLLLPVSKINDPPNTTLVSTY